MRTNENQIIDGQSRTDGATCIKLVAGTYQQQNFSLHVVGQSRPITIFLTTCNFSLLSLFYSVCVCQPVSLLISVSLSSSKSGALTQQTQVLPAGRPAKCRRLAVWRHRRWQRRWWRRLLMGAVRLPVAFWQ